MSDERIPMSREGYEKLKADLDRMQNVEMTEIAKRVAAARELGDLKENAEYHAAREDHGMLQARVNALKDKLGRAYIIDRANGPSRHGHLRGAREDQGPGLQARKRSTSWWDPATRITTTTRS